jgi:enoyl-CoA hydratase/carnithine racemase
MSAPVRVTDDGAIRIVRMERSDKKNALNTGMYQALADALAGVKALPQIRCVVLAGVPGAFSAGNDMEEFRAAAESGEGLSDEIIRFLHAIACCDRPIVAAVDGLAVGVGTTLLFHCDYVVASGASRFVTPFAQLALIPEAGSTLLAPLVMGQRRAFALLVMGEPMNAQSAQAAGLVNVVTDGGDVEKLALEAAQRIAKLSSEAVLAARRMMKGSPEAIIERIDEEADYYREHLQSPAALAAFEAFFARKK